MEDEIVYIAIDNWGDYSEYVGDFVERLDNEEVDVNCNMITYDQAIIFYITTTLSWLKEHNLEVLKDKFVKDYDWSIIYRNIDPEQIGRTKYHPEYDLSKIGTDENYKLVDLL